MLTYHRRTLSRSAAGGNVLSRRLAFESLESRRVLTVFTVNNLGDAPFNNTDFVVTLRDAITAANNNVAAFPGGPVGDELFGDSIQFQAGLNGTITLTQGELLIRSRMSINGPGSSMVVVSGGNSSRVFNVSNSMPSIVFASIRGLAIGFGNAANSLGGGILNRESLTIENCVIAANHAAKGAGIYNADTGNLNIIGSDLTANTADGITTDDGGSALYNLGQATIASAFIERNDGVGPIGPVANLSGGTLTISDSEIIANNQNALSGGIDNKGTLTVRRSGIDNNKSQGGFVGGVLNSGTATMVNSAISGNSDSGVGGVLNSGTMTMQNCTVNGNSGTVLAGGISNQGTLRLENSTISGNTLNGNAGDGAGGVYNAYSSDSLVIANCTITLNRALSSAVGVGGFHDEGLANATLFNSIFIDNSRGAGTVRNDMFVIFPLNGLCANNIVGVAEAFTQLGITNGSNGNQVGVTDAKLGLLAKNGGLTQTHALLAGSPAINAGSNGAIPLDTLDLDGDGVTTTEQLPFDQRGMAFSRIVGGQVDIGAFEAGAVSANFDLDADIDGIDFLAWQRGFGLSGEIATRANGNADGDGDVDGVDFGIWKTQFGNPPGSSAAATPAVAADLVFAGDYAALAASTATNTQPAWRRRRR